MDSFIPDEPKDQRTWLRRCEAVAHATTASAFALTIFLIATGRGTELNVVADTLFGTVGWAATGVVALSVIVVSFLYYERHIEDHPRVVLTGGASLALAGIGDLALNLWVFYVAGMPETVWWPYIGPSIGVVLLVGLVATFRHWIVAEAYRLKPPTRAIRAVGFAFLVVMSIVAIPFMGGISPQSSTDGVASASDHGEFSNEGNYTGHTDSVFSVTMGSDGYLYSGAGDNEIHKIDPSTMTKVDSYAGHTNMVFSVTMGSDGYLYSGARDNEVHKIDPSDMSQADSYAGHANRVESVTMGSDGYLYSGSYDNEVHKIDPSGMTKQSAYTGHTDNVKTVTMGSDGYLYSGSYDTGVHRIDPSDMSQVGSYTGHPNSVFSVTMGSDGYLYSGAGDNETHRIDPSDMTKQSAYTGHSDGVLSVTMGADGYLYSGSKDEEVHRIDPSDMTKQSAYTGHSFAIESVTMGGDGYLYSGSSDNEAHRLDPGTGTTSDPISGVVTDRDGDPVTNATVYATGYDAADPPPIDGTPFDEIAADPLPDGWDSQTDEDWADRGQIDAEGADWDSTRVLMHSDEQWEIDHSWPDTRVFGKEIGPDPDLHPIPSTLSMEDKVVFSCWEPQSGFPDTFDDSMPGYETTPCDITIQKVDPLGDVQHEETVETKPSVKVTALSNLGTKEHDAYYAGDMSEGVYHVYPDEDPSAGLYYAIAPDGDVTVLKSEIENWASSRSDSISQYNQEIKNEYDAGNLELVSAKTNSTGHYSLDVPNQATKAELRVIKDGGENAASPGDLTRTDLRNEYDSAVRTNFDDATGVGFEDASEETFVDVCRRMDPVADDVGIPFHGSESTDIPNQNADIEGEYVIPKDLHPRVRKCAAISIVESLLDGDLGWLSPGLADNLADLTDAELEAMLSTVQSMLGTNDVLCEEFADAIGASSCDDAIEDPSELTREEKENRVREGFGIVDDSSDNMNGGGGGGIVGGGSGGVDVGDGDTSVGDETFSTDWNVGGVSDWDDAELMLRLTWSDGTTTVLNQSSEHVSIDESTLGADTVHLSEYPIGDEDPAAVQARLDVVTSESTGSGDTGSVKNPTWDGDIPSLNSLKVSKWEPGEQDSFTVGVEAADSSRFGSLQRVEVTAPDGTTTTHDTVEDGEITAQTKTAGDHRVAVVFTANDDNATEFTEVVQVRAGSTSKGRPPSIRGQSGAIGRYAVVGHGLDAGEVDVARGGSEVTMTGVLPQDADVPQTLTADTTDISISTDATTTVRLRRGSTRQTIRDRINVVLYADEIDDDALVWRNGDALTREGTQWGEVTVKNGTTVDTISDETASVAIRVNGDPSVVDRVRHWVNANVNIPSLPIGMAAFDVSPLLAALVALRRRDPPEPPKPDIREHRQPNPQEV